MPQLADVFTYLSCSDSLQGKMEGLTSLVTDLCKDRVCAEEVENLAKRFHVQDAEQCRLTFLLYANVLKITIINFPLQMKHVEKWNIGQILLLARAP